MHTRQNSPSALALFSGGLDSLLAARLIMEQGIQVHCIHFVSPFFGSAASVPVWEKRYGLSVTAVDISDTFITLLRESPPHGFGKVLNPCVDCKILMIRAIRTMMETHGASFIISGEVIGQRPMSQRRDTLNLIKHEAEAESWLLRPLCALHLDPTPMEEQGLVDRSRLKGFFGRGRKEQLRLAEDFGITDIPTPAGGCRLTEKENARRFWPLLHHCPWADAQDFYLANVGRQLWARTLPEGLEHAWLSVGRQQEDNARLLELARPEDMLFKLADIPGPIALGRRGSAWAPQLLADAASYMASFAPKAIAMAQAGEPVQVRAWNHATDQVMTVVPERQTPSTWGDFPWEDVRSHVRAVNCALEASKKAARVPA